MSPSAQNSRLFLFSSVLTQTNHLLLSQHVHGVPGGGCGSYRVAGADGDVSDRETAQTGEKVSQHLSSDNPSQVRHLSFTKIMCVLLFVFEGGLGVVGLSGGRHAPWDRRRAAVNHPEHPDSRSVTTTHTTASYFSPKLILISTLSLNP